VGKAAFDREIENEQFVGSPTLTVDRLVDEGETVPAIGNGETTHRGETLHRFAFRNVFAFAGEAICRVESYVVPVEGGV
jgi:hypothetical protein